MNQEAPKRPPRKDSSVGTYERVRKTLDEALAELQLPPDADTSRIRLTPPPLPR